jgi:hypothetical protein
MGGGSLPENNLVISASTMPVFTRDVSGLPGIGAHPSGIVPLQLTWDVGVADLYCE